MGVAVSLLLNGSLVFPLNVTMYDLVKSRNSTHVNDAF